MKKAFTLMELIIVIIIASAIAGFALNNYLKTIEISEARNAITLARAIQAAEEVYLAKNGVYWPEVDGHYDIDEINANLDLSIESGNLYIWCDNDPSTTGYSFAVYDCCLFYPASDSRWKYEITGDDKYPHSVNITDTAPIYMPQCKKNDSGC